MSLDVDELEDQADAGASSTEPSPAGNIKKNNHVLIKGRPCKVRLPKCDFLSGGSESLLPRPTHSRWRDASSGDGSVDRQDWQARSREVHFHGA